MAREMKDSGVEWIGDIPADWKLERLKWILAERKEKNDPQRTDFILSLGAAYGVVPYSEKEGGGNKAKETLTDYRLAYPNDIVINSMNIISGSVGLSKYFGCVSPVYYMLYPQDSTYSSEYYCYLFQTIAFQRSLLGLGNGILMKESSTGTFNTVRMRIPMEKLGVQLLPVPSVKQQEQIVSFLNYECSRIDKALEQMRASIEEYKKMKQIVITQAVTKGIRPGRQMKDSGIPWIREIPKEWKVALLKYSIKWKSIKGEPDAQVLSLYRDFGVIPKDSRDDNYNVTSLDTGAYKVVDIGDFVINKMKAWQGSMAISDYRGIVSPAYHVCEVVDSRIYKPYFHFLLRNQLYIPEYTRLSTGMRTGQWDLGFDDFRNIPFILPSMEEQKEIVEYIENKSHIIDSIIDLRSILIIELEEYKKSLIYEYVTGKKEVPACQ